MANPNPSPETRFKPGQSGNPGGRAQGKTMKEYAREYLMCMSDEEKHEWLKGVPKQFIWRMAEGNPHQDKGVILTQSISVILDELEDGA